MWRGPSFCLCRNYCPKSRLQLMRSSFGGIFHVLGESHSTGFILNSLGSDWFSLDSGHRPRRSYSFRSVSSWFVWRLQDSCLILVLVAFFSHDFVAMVCTKLTLCRITPSCCCFTELIARVVVVGSIVLSQDSGLTFGTFVVPLDCTHIFGLWAQSMCYTMPLVYSSKQHI